VRARPVAHRRRAEAAADAEDHAPARQTIELGDLSGDVQRVAHGQQVGSRRKLQAGRSHRGRGQQQQRRGHRTTTCEVALRQPERSKAERFSALGLPGERLRTATPIFPPRRNADVKPVCFAGCIRLGHVLEASSHRAWIWSAVSDPVE